jgi:tetratricopeptide (TPR) repeat protein
MGMPKLEIRKPSALTSLRPVPGLAITLALTLLLGACDSSRSGLTREQYRTAATALFERQLYQEAIDAYQRYLDSPALAPEDAPKVLFQMGVIYQDNLMDARGALAQFTLVKSLYPDQTFGNDLGKRMVAALEAMGRSIDASQARARITDLTPDTAAAVPGEGAVVADVDGRKITLGEIKAMAGKLPEAPLELNQLAREYVAQILIADAARRKGLADKPEIKLRLGQVENQILAQAGLMDEIKIAPPTGNDLKYYFEANKARYVHGPDSASAGDGSAASFDKLLPRIQADWAREKQGAAYQQYVERLLQAGKVRFFSVIAGEAKPR